MLENILNVRLGLYFCNFQGLVHLNDLPSLKKDMQTFVLSMSNFHNFFMVKKVWIGVGYVLRWNACYPSFYQDVHASSKLNKLT